MTTLEEITKKIACEHCPFNIEVDKESGTCYKHWKQILMCEKEYNEKVLKPKNRGD